MSRVTASEPGRPTGRRTGRRPGESGTREAILQAARRQFAALGYRGATIRGIAAEAGVDPALLRHYFMDKDGLFGAALEFPAGVLPAVRRALDGPLDDAGERLTRAYLGIWEDPEAGPAMAALVASAVSNPQAQNRLRSMIAGTLLPNLSPSLGPAEAPRRLTLAASHLIGIAIVRYVVRAPVLADLDLDTVVACVAPSVQGYLTGPLPGDRSRSSSSAAG